MASGASSGDSEKGAREARERPVGQSSIDDEVAALRRALADDPENDRLMTALWGALHRQGTPIPTDVELAAARFSHEQASVTRASSADPGEIAAAARRYLIADAVVNATLKAELAPVAFAGVESEQEAHRFVHAVTSSPAKPETREALYRLAGHMWAPAREVALQLLASSLYDRGERNAAIATLESTMELVRSIEPLTALYLRYLPETHRPIPAELEELSWRRAFEADPDNGRAATALWGGADAAGKADPARR